MNNDIVKPMFSILVPVYNIEEYVGRCLESLISQTYSDFEVLVVDDGSTDKSGMICDSYAKSDMRIKVIHQQNRGLVAARKTACQAAKGVYCINVDGDDYLESYALKEICSLINKYDCDMLAFSLSRVYKDKKTPDSFLLLEGLYKGIDIAEFLLYDENQPFYTCGYSYSLCTKAIKREVYVKYQMLVPDKIKMGEDVAVVLPVLSEIKHVFVSNIALYCYCIIDDSMSHTVRWDDIKQLKLLLTHIENNCDCSSENLKQQLSAYVIIRLWQIFSMQCRAMSCYRDFKILTNDVDAYLLKKIRYCKYNFKSLKGLIVPFLLKHKLFFPFWLIYHKS